MDLRRGEAPHAQSLTPTAVADRQADGFAVHHSALQLVAQPSIAPPKSCVSRDPSTRNIHVIEPLHRRHQFALEAGRGGCGLERPGHHVDVVFLEQRLEPGQFVFAPIGVVAIVEALKINKTITNIK